MRDEPPVASLWQASYRLCKACFKTVTSLFEACNLTTIAIRKKERKNKKTKQAILTVQELRVQGVAK